MRSSSLHDTPASVRSILIRSNHIMTNTVDASTYDVKRDQSDGPPLVVHHLYMSMRSVAPGELARRLTELLARYAQGDRNTRVSARQISLAAAMQASELSNALARFRRGESKDFSIAKWAAIGEVCGADEGWWFADLRCEHPIDDSLSRRRRIQRLAIEAEHLLEERNRRQSSRPPPMSPEPSPESTRSRRRLGA